MVLCLNVTPLLVSFSISGEFLRERKKKITPLCYDQAEKKYLPGFYDFFPKQDFENASSLLYSMPPQATETERLEAHTEHMATLCGKLA